LITSRMKRRIKQDLSAEKPTVWIGKEGATVQIISEIIRQLEQREVVKAKILQTALKDMETREIAKEIANQTGSTLIDTRGHTFVLYKVKKKSKVAK